MKTVFIYALNCPITGAVRYVGKAANPTRRYAGHLCYKGKNHRGSWIRYLRDAGAEPILEILDEVPESEWQSWEAAYIQFFREEGCDLTNGNAGGLGGANPTAGTRAKLRAANSGENNPFFGRECSPEHRAKISAALMGKPHSAEHCANTGASQKGKTHSPEHSAKQSVGQRGRIDSEETKARKSAAGKVAWVLRKEKANASLA